MTWFTLYVTVAWLLRAAMVPTILRREFAPGASMAWLGITFLHPYIGWALYLLFGETRLEPRRIERHRQLVLKYRKSNTATASPDSALPELPSAYHSMVLQAEKISVFPVLAGNSADFITEADPFISRLCFDIDAATSHIHLLYYIFTPDSTGARVADALRAAAQRGVKCRVLVDAVASHPFLGRGGLSAALMAAGVEIAAALPVAPISRQLPRMDLRNHRKLAILDDRVAYLGSHNVCNADYGGRRGEPWVDLTARLTGPVITQLATVFAEDWTFESGKEIDLPKTVTPTERGTPMQVVPTGPSASGESYRRVLLAAVQSAQRELTLTTPYFVPDDPTLVALMMAADRGVTVKLIMPETPDHILTAAAGRAHFARLMNAGVGIYLYRPGLLHSKTTTVDDAFAIVGSANLDVRSFNLNFELSLLLYGHEVTTRVRAIQQNYLAESTPVNAEEWSKRSVWRRYADSAVSLLSPSL